LKFVCGLFRVPVDEYVEVARAAERAGFDALSLSDHIVHVEEVESRFPYSTDGRRPWSETDDYPDVWVATAMMAAVTQRLRFLQAIYVLPARNPFTIAKALGTLARMSGHRVSLGFGVGWMREEFDLMDQAFERRGARAEEMIELMKKLWSGDLVDHQGEFYRFSGVRMRPAVGGPIPILCSGESDAALRRAARIGDGWIPPISISSPDALAAKLEQIRAHRREAGRESEPFSVYWTPGADIDLHDHSDLTRIGVSHIFSSPWGFEEAETLGLEEKRDRIAQFGRDVIGTRESQTPAASRGSLER
jgi:probable F420-dependent oxidoreductase